MENLIFGIILIIVCTVGYGLSWRFWLRENYRTALFLLLACGLFLRIYTSTDFFLHNWDERYHAVVAKNILEHPLSPTLYDDPVLPYDYTNWTGNHIWLHKQPLPLWTMAASMWIFGVNEIALRIPSILLTTIGIFLTFSIGSYLFNQKAAYIAAFLYSVNGLIIELTGGRVATDHFDIFFLFFIELGVYFSILFVQKGKIIYNVFTGITIGLAILCKWLPALIVFPIWFLLVFESRRLIGKALILHLVMMLVICLAVFLPWQIYIFSEFPLEAKWESDYNFRHLVEVIEGRSGPFYYFLDKIRIVFGELIYLPLAWFIWRIIKNPFNKKMLAVLVWIFVPFLFFSLAKTKMQGYILFTAPAIFMLISGFYITLSEYYINHKKKWLLNLVLVLLIALPVRYTIERVKPFEKMDRSPQWVSDLKMLNERNIENGLLFNCQRPVEAMFYTNLTAYSNIPEINVISDLLEKGYTIAIVNGGEIPENIKKMKGLIWLNIN